MKTLVLVLLSTLFVSSMSKKNETDSIKKVLTYRIGKTEETKVKSLMNSRTPIIIVKRD